MIQQSQLQAKAMFLEPDNFHFYNSLLASEQPKIGVSLESEEEYKLIAPDLCKKYSKKSLSKDTSKPRKQKSFEDSNSNRKFGHWSLEENKRYHWFLQIHNNHFFNKHLRRTDKIFKSMALFVGSRQAEQCRSHHQKMQKKHHSICNILSSLRREHYGCENQGLLIQDLRQNKVQIIDQILSSKFLKEQRVNSVGSVQNIEGQKTSLEQLQLVQDIVYQFMNDQKKVSEEDIYMLAEKVEACDRDIVEILLSEQAPHNNYQMI